MALVLDGNGDITGLVAGALPANVIGTGSVIQTATTFISGKNSTTSSSYTDLAKSNSFTPSSSSNRILVFISCQMGNAGSAGNVLFAIGRSVSGGSSSAIADVQNLLASATYANFPFSYIYLNSPATTSALTYSIMGRREDGDGTPFVGGRNSDSFYQWGTYITLMEIAG